MCPIINAAAANSSPTTPKQTHHYNTTTIRASTPPSSRSSPTPVTILPAHLRPFSKSPPGKISDRRSISRGRKRRRIEEYSGPLVGRSKTRSDQEFPTCKELNPRRLRYIEMSNGLSPRSFRSESSGHETVVQNPREAQEILWVDGKHVQEKVINNVEKIAEIEDSGLRTPVSDSPLAKSNTIAGSAPRRMKLQRLSGVAEHSPAPSYRAPQASLASTPERPTSLEAEKENVAPVARMISSPVERKPTSITAVRKAATSPMPELTPIVISDDLMIVCGIPCCRLDFEDVNLQALKRKDNMQRSSDGFADDEMSEVSAGDRDDHVSYVSKEVQARGKKRKLDDVAKEENTCESVNANMQRRGRIALAGTKRYNLRSSKK